MNNARATRAEAATVSVIPTRCGDHPNHHAATCPECTTIPPTDPSPYVDEIRAAIRDLSAERRRLKQGAS